MLVFVYEYFTGGGAAGGAMPQGPAAASLLSEAGAMIRWVTEDFAALPSVRVVTTRDERLPPLHSQNCEVVGICKAESDLEVIRRLANEADWTLLIAPESEGALVRRARLVEHSGRRLLSPGSRFVEIAASKQATAEALEAAGVPVPRGFVWSAGDLPISGDYFPAVIKPVDGCGSQEVRLIANANESEGHSRGTRWRVEEFVRGWPASVSVLCGPGRIWPLIACEQRLTADGRFSYLGGRLPLADELDCRARQLALLAIEALPKTIGYVGVDLVLGDAADGSGDRVIEVNPRLTTSYVGLRATARANLAAAMLAVADGKEPDLSFGSEPIEFTSAGTILS